MLVSFIFQIIIILFKWYINTPNKVLEIKNIKSIFFFKAYEKIQIENNDLNTEGYNFWNKNIIKWRKETKRSVGYTCYEFETLNKNLRSIEKNYF